MERKKKYSNLIFDMALFAIGALGSKILLFLLVPLYTNVLSDIEYGIADLVFTVSDLLLPLMSLAVYNGLLRFGLIPEKQQESVKCTWIVFLFGMIITFLFTPIIGLYRPVEEYKWLLSLKVISTFANSNSMIGLKIKGKNKAYAVFSIIQALLLVVSNIIFLVYFKFGVIGYLLSTIISLSVTALLAFVYSGAINDILVSKYNHNLMKDIIVFSIPFIFNDISWWLVHSSDKVMIEWMINKSVLGLYTAATKIPSFINSVTAIFSQAWGIASIKEFDDSNDTEFYSKVFKYFFIIIYGVCVCVISVIKPFMSIYLGKEFVEAWHYVPLLLVSASFAAISTFAGSLFGALKKSKDLMNTTIVSAIANIIINFFFIPICGVWGAVIGTVVAYVVVSVSRLITIYKYLRMDYSLMLFIPMSLLLIVEGIFIGLDFYVLPVGIVSLLLYFIFIRKEINPIIEFVKDMFKKKIK